VLPKVAYSVFNIRGAFFLLLSCFGCHWQNKWMLMMIMYHPNELFAKHHFCIV